MKKFIFVLAVGFSSLFIFEKNAYACRCVAPPNLPVEELVQKAQNDADAVFTGKVLSISKKTSLGYNLVKIRMSQGWKGNLKRDVIIKTGSGGENCGVTFEVGKQYLVYAKQKEKYLETDLCTRTAKTVDAADDLKVLGKGKTTVGK